MTGQHTPGRRRTLIRTGIATAAALAVASGAAPFLIQGAQAEPAALTIPAPDRYMPRSYGLAMAGTTGHLTRVERDGDDPVNTATGYQWMTADGDPQPIGADPADSSAERILGSPSDVVGVYTTATRSVELKDMKAGTSTTFTLPEGHTYHGNYGDTVLSASWTSSREIEALHLLRMKDGQLTDTPVTGENGVKPSAVTALGWGAGTLAIRVSGDSTGSFGLVDLSTGEITAVVPRSYGSGDSQVEISEKYVAWFDPRYGDQQVHVLRRDSLGGAESTVPLPSSYDQESFFKLVGDWIVSNRQTRSFRNSDAPKDRGEPLLARPIAGGDAKTLLPHARTALAATPDGAMLAPGGSSAGDWAVHRVSQAADGSLDVTKARAIQPKEGTFGAVTLAAGDLAFQSPDANYLPSLYRRHIELGDNPTAGQHSLVAQPPLSTDGTGGTAGNGAVATGDGRFAYQSTTPGANGVEARTGPDDGVTVRTATNGSVLDASGRYVVYGEGYTSSFGEHTQYVVDLDKSGDDKVLLTRPASASAVWGTKFWTPGDTAGTVKATDLKTGTTESFSVGKECTFTDLQAVGRWVYWSCGVSGEPNASGVWDRTTRRNIDVPSGGELGDGYVVRHDETVGKLQLLDFHTADGSVETRDVADINTWFNRGYYAVDRFGGGVAYVPGRGDKAGAMNAVGSGVPTSPLVKIESHPERSVDLKSATDKEWNGFWQLSKPATGATVEVKDRAGKVVRTLDAGQHGAALSVAWDGKVSDSAYAADGTYTWQLSAAPKDGSGAALSLSGTFTLSGGMRGHHDLNGGAGDLVTLSPSGYLTTHYGDGKGAFGSKASGSGWPAGTYTVPFGDLTKDRCNDLLVRTPEGTLRRYTGKCAGGGYSPSSAYTAISTGWQQYDVLTAPGDLTGDGRTDLIARQASTGDVYLYADNGAGGFKSRVKIRSAWTTYTRIAGVGDLNGDGFGDLLARRSDGTLFRYDGTGAGQFKDRVTVFTSWGKTYNAMVGVGDITGDGKGDLVVRDTSGNLYRNDGKGNGSFSSRTQIATGWQGYTGLF
ncbi:FG-GAP-like repeat-containing protein [Streptomyces sp. 8N616]|uniref:FG-GAP-like repeat-containing protein n=1 Tax=Streptomyces sp. 8N616 TaxID=3457414 RepID=UPI003FD14FEB